MTCNHDCKQGDACDCRETAQHVYPLRKGAKPLKFAPGVIECGSNGWSMPNNFTDLMIFIALIGAFVLLYVGTAVLAGFIARSLGLA